MRKDKAKYDETSVRVLEPVEAIRQKPGMYVGDTENFGLWVILKEAIDNALDEAGAGHGKRVEICVSTKKGVMASVRDYGRGIPIGKHPKTKKPVVTTVLTQTHAGAKFDSSTYKSAVGTHGVGITATNALSKFLIVASAKDGKWHSQTFTEGVEASELKAMKAAAVMKNNRTNLGTLGKKCVGTFIAFHADNTIFKDAELNKTTVVEYLRLMSCSHRKVVIALEWNGKAREYSSPDGFLSWIRRDRKRLEASPLFDVQPFVYEGEGVACALEWVDSVEAELVSSVSGARTARGGTHVRGFLDALQSALKLKSKMKVSPDNLLVGISGVLNVNLSAPSFSGQTKEVLASPGAKALVTNALVKSLTSYFRKNSQLRDAIIERAVALHKADNDHKAARKLVSSLKVNKGGKILLPAKLSACPTCAPKDREVYIVEGDSAGGTIKTARNSKFQEVLPLRGKVMNVARNSNPTESQEVLAILQTIGFSAKEKQEYRVGKIIIAADSDSDGNHISALVLTVLAKFCPDVFEKNMVYLSDVPLYSYKSKSDFVHSDTLEGLKKKVKEPFDKKKLTRAKGLGELNADEARFSLMNPDTRMLLKVDPFGSNKHREHFWRLVGEDVQMRRELLGI